MNTHARKWLLALVMVLTLAFAISSTAAAQPLGQAEGLPQIKTPNSVKVDMTGSIASGGQTVNMDGSGAVMGSDFMLSVTLHRPEGVTTGPEQVMASAIVKGQKLYYMLNGFGISGISDNQWYVADLSTIMQGSGGTQMGMPGDLTGLTQAVMDAITVKNVGKETIGGFATTHYTINANIAKVLVASGSSTPDAEEIAKNSSLTMDLWVGNEDMYVHRYSISLKIDVPGSAPLAFDMTLNFRDFDVPVDIAAPQNAIPVDLSGAGSVLSNISLGGVVTAMPGMSTGMGTSVGMPKTGSGSGSSPVPFAVLAFGALLLTSGVVLRRRAATVR